MSTMQTFYARLTTGAQKSAVEPLALLTQTNLPQVRSLAVGWWDW